MDELTPGTREALGQAITPIASGYNSPASEVAAFNDQLEGLDRYYAEEILEKLNGIVSRASALDRMGLEIVPNRRVQFLFEQAHCCYLYGFHLACAVFCRAILEGALKEVADPHSETNQSIHEMIAMAVEIGILTDDRPRSGQGGQPRDSRPRDVRPRLFRGKSARSSDQHAESAARIVPAAVRVSVLRKHAVVPHERGRSRLHLESFSRIQQNRYRTFIHQLDLHHLLEAAGFAWNACGSDSVHKIFVELTSALRRGCRVE
jgi:hypothetical protein